MFGLFFLAGGCINASPAGKRRIAAGAEQQFGSPYNSFDDSSSNGVLARVGSPLTTITAIAVAGCLLIVTVFAVIFAVLQVSFIMWIQEFYVCSSMHFNVTIRWHSVALNGELISLH